MLEARSLRWGACELRGYLMTNNLEARHLRGNELCARYWQVRTATETLCETLAPEDYVAQSMPDASPVKWHLAHTTWFFEEFILQKFVPGYRFHNEAFRYLFNSYYQQVGPMHARPQRGLLTRPTIDQTRTYRAQVDESMHTLLDHDDVPEELARLVTLGLHHEQQHQELLLTDVKHLFSCNPMLPAYTTHVEGPTRIAPPLLFREFPGGVVELGYDGNDFCFDNELPRHKTYAQPFRLANRAVTNGDLLEFIRDGGYERPEHWLSEGWSTVQREGWQRPIYWTPGNEQEFTLTGLRALNPNAPACHLSYFEADAFARWAGARMPTETEWEVASAAATGRGNFVEDRAWHPLPAAPNPASQPATPLLQMFGDVWEWTQSAYTPYPGYRAAEGALGEYNGKFMVNQLVLRGGSCATPRRHIRPTYRNFFPATARWQFTGLRLAADL